VEPLEGLIAIPFLCRKIRTMADENPSLSAIPSSKPAGAHLRKTSMLEKCLRQLWVSRQ
jgi:hypothetical protein